MARNLWAQPWVPAIAGAAAGAAAFWAFSRRNARSAQVDVIEKAVLERRSMFLQDLNGEEAPDAAVEAMLSAANWAPTHGQTQPWRFHVMRRKTDAVDKFFNLQASACEAWIKSGTASAEAVKEMNKFTTKLPKKFGDIRKASHVIAVIMKRQANPEKIMPEWEEIAATACAVQNAHILGCAHGVAAYWSSGGTEGPLAAQEVRNFLKLEEGDRCLGLIYVGMADDATWAKSQARAVRGSPADKTEWH